MLTELLGFSAGIICIMYRGSGPGGFQNLNSELPESVICIMFRGSGPGCVQNSNFEYLRGTKYCKIRRMEAKGGPETEWRAGGPARAAGGRNSDFIRGLQISAGILSLGLTRLEPRWGRRIPVRLRVSRRAALVALVGGWMGK